MTYKFKAAALTIALAAAFNMTAVGRSFAVWCSADAPMVYTNMVTNFMPFLSKLVGGTGLSTEDAVVQAGGAVRGEILKSALAEKAVSEGIEAYEQQAALQQRARDVTEAMRQPEGTCQALATADSISAATQSTQVRVLESQRIVLAKTSVSANTNTLAVVDKAFRESNAKFCTPEDKAKGICEVRAGGEYASLAGADRNAAFLFQDTSGSSSFEGRGGAQAEAAGAYIARVVGGLPPQALPQQGAEFYQQNPQARAYVELSRRYNAMQSISAYSLNQIKEMHRTQTGLGSETMLATVPGFPANKADMSMSEVIERFVATKFSPKAVADLATAEKPNLILRDMAQMDSFSLWMSFQGMQQSMRVEALQAHQLALVAEQALRPQLDAQRTAASRSNVAKR